MSEERSNDNSPRDPDPSASRRQAALDAARRDLAAAAAKYRDAANWYGTATRSKP